MFDSFKMKPILGDPFIIMYLLVIRRKDLCEARPKMQSVFKFSDVLFTLKSDVPPW